MWSWAIIIHLRIDYSVLLVKYDCNFCRPTNSLKSNAMRENAFFYSMPIEGLATKYIQFVSVLQINSNKILNLKAIVNWIAH